MTKGVKSFEKAESATSVLGPGIVSTESYPPDVAVMRCFLMVSSGTEQAEAGV